MTPTVLFNHAILDWAEEVCDMAGASVAASGTKKLRKTWELLELAQAPVGQVPGLPGDTFAPPVKCVNDICV